MKKLKKCLVCRVCKPRDCYAIAAHRARRLMSRRRMRLASLAEIRRALRDVEARLERVMEAA